FVTALIATIGLVTIQPASARPGAGRAIDCPRGYQTTQLDQETLDKMTAFRTENQELRKQIVIKQTAKRALMRSNNPDATQAGQLAGELFDLRQEMHQKAEAAGLSGYMMRGEGRGYGRHQGYGMGNNNGYGQGPHHKNGNNGRQHRGLMNN
nr:hypothetical protein [Candidatus Desulfatifera sulfidica]